MEPTRPGESRPAADLRAAEDVSGAPPGDMPPPLRVLVVRNPRSHRNRTETPSQADTADVVTIAPRSRQALADALAEFAQRGVELLVIDGGDGTMRDVLTRGMAAFGENWPRLIVLPKGKTNALAVDLGMPDKCSLEEALAALPAARLEVRRPIVIDRHETGGAPSLGFILGAGVFNAAIDAGQVAHRFGAFQGFAVALTALFAVVQALFGIGRSPWRALTPMEVRPLPGGQDVAHSGHGTPGQRFASGFSTLRKFPLGMKPFADAGGSDGSRKGMGIQYLVVDSPLRRIVAMVPLILMGLDRPFLRRLGIHRGAADEIGLELGGSFILDGEAFPPGSYRLRLGPELRFVVP